MEKLEEIISVVLTERKPQLASSSFESLHFYCNQLSQMASKMNITVPCQKLYDAFIEDDRNSKERSSRHRQCVKLVDYYAGTHAKDERGNPFNRSSLPTEDETKDFFKDVSYPISIQITIDHLIIKSELEMRGLKLSSSTIGQYKHSWLDIRDYFNKQNAGIYASEVLQQYISEINGLRSKCLMNEWKWKMNRKAAHVLLEVADTGTFNWKPIQQNLSFTDQDLEELRTIYINTLREKNLSKATINLYDYVFRKTLSLAEIQTIEELAGLSYEETQLIIASFSTICNKRSMATILPILRSLLTFLFENNVTDYNLSNVIMSRFIQKGNVSAYLSVEDERRLIEQLEQESMRTKAIILLALRFGLRDSDVCNLTLQSIDWNKEKLYVVQQKTGESIIFPLLPEIGNALMEYILHERHPRIDYPYIFLRKQAPYNKITSAYPSCSKLLNKLKIQPVNGKTKGLHLFRYTLTHRLLSAKVPHQVVTDILGHTSKESDKPYISLEESMLRMCALDLSEIGKIHWGEDKFE